MPSIFGLLIQLFVAISEKVFLRWRESAKAKQVKNAETTIDAMPDDDVIKQLHKYDRD